MAHHRACDHGAGSGAPIRADETVGNVAHRPRAGRPEASGINHRCGAQLTLREAAAAAGGPLETLLATVTKAVRPPH
jgi:hypothetical protein